MYMYYNRNIDDLRIEDCVCRAISTATNLKYEAVEKLLDISADLFGCDKLNMPCYNNLLSNILCYRQRFCYSGETVEEIADRYPNDNVLMRLDGHLTCSIKGCVLDTFDCSQERVDCYWVIR